MNVFLLMLKFILNNIFIGVFILSIVSCGSGGSGGSGDTEGNPQPDPESQKPTSCFSSSDVKSINAFSDFESVVRYVSNLSILSIQCKPNQAELTQKFKKR